MADFYPDTPLWAGDDWLFTGTLKNADGGAFDLTDAEFEWMLADADGKPVTAAADAVTITPDSNLTDRHQRSRPRDRRPCGWSLCRCAARPRQRRQPLDAVERPHHVERRSVRLARLCIIWRSRKC
jgi:hypothetical protein